MHKYGFVLQSYKYIGIIHDSRASKPKVNFLPCAFREKYLE